MQKSEKTEGPRFLIKATLLAIAVTCLGVMLVQVIVRLTTGKTIAGPGVAIGVPVTFTVLWTLGYLRRRRSR